jgi:DNA repair exonuclease SbcCD ATPase subunit
MTTYFKKVRFKNLFATGDSWIEVDLNRHRSVMFMGKNGSGKSTVIDALCFALYKKPFKKIVLPDLVNRSNNKNLLVEVEFDVGEIEYKVRRGIKPNLFEIYKNGNLVEQDAKTGDYQDYLEGQILKMNYKSFTQIVVLGIANYVPFMRLKTPERREVVEDLLDYSVFSFMNSILSEKIKIMKKSTAEIASRLSTVEGKIEVNQTYLDAIKADNDKEINEKKKTLKNMKSVHDTNSKKLEEHMVEMDRLQESVGDEDQVDEMIRKIEDERKKLFHEAEAIKKELSFYKDHDQCPTCNQNIDATFKKDHVSALRGNCTLIQNKIEALVKKREPLMARQIEINTILSDEIVPIQSEIDGLQATINANLRHAKALNAEIKSMQEDTGEEYQDMTKELEAEKKAVLSDKRKLEMQSAIYANAAMLLKDTGIKARLIRAFVPKMNELINNYLVELDFFGHFEMDENFDAVIRARHRDELSYEGLSQGQKLRIDLALLFTWRAIAKMRSNALTNLLIFDEVCDSSLDDDGIEDLMKILNGMADGHNIFIISHKGDAIIDKFEQVYKFELVESYTTMKEVA